MYKFHISDIKFDGYPESHTTKLVWRWYEREDQYWNCIIDSGTDYVSFSTLDNSTVHLMNQWGY